MRTLLVASQKGGVGKTTTAVNLAALAAGAGRVLLIDADPLGSVAASLQLSRDPDDGGTARPDGVTGKGAAWADVLPGLDVICPYPADDTTEDRLFEFLDQLPKSPAARFYDRVVLDAPPMPGPRTKALLMAADDVLVVQRAEPMSLRTLPVYLELVRAAQQAGGGCRLKGILLTLPAGLPAGGKAEQALRAKFQGLLPQTVPFDPEINRALVLGKPAVVHNPSCPAAVQYRSLAAVLGLVRGKVKAPALVGAATAAGTTDAGVTERPAVPTTNVACPTPPPAAPRVKAVERPVEKRQAPPAGRKNPVWRVPRAALVLACAAALGLLLWFVTK